ncbi:hypothetical protein FCOIX_5634 [Fusarium coicis]|nr:hypothetical protein FCOIX_5634 [Fusarium coicis]
MESERDCTPPMWRKPINTVNAVARPTTVESRSVGPASEPLLLDQENDPKTTTKALDQKQSASAVGVVSINDQIHRLTLNQEDSAIGGYRTEKVSPYAETTVISRVSWENTLRRIIEGWWQEMLCCLVSVVALVVLTLTLRKFNNQPLPDWPSGITLNTVLACISTVCRAALLIPVTEGLAQAKWVWFKQPRPLKDFEAFDKASRGLGGSLSLLSHTKGWSVGIIAAFLLSTTIATSTITQFSITYPSRFNQDGSKGSAEAWRLGESWGKDDPDYAIIDNVLRMNKSTSQIPKLHTSQGDEDRRYMSLEIPGKDNVIWTIERLSTRTIATQLNDSLSGYTVVLAGEPMRGTSGSGILALATQEVLQNLAKGNSTLEIQEAERAWWMAVEGMAVNIANSLTNTLLPDQSNVDGVSLDTEVYVQVRWEWLALLSVQVALSISLLICIIVQSAKAEVEIMKGSTVPVLFAISAVDKARMENGDIDLDSLRQMKNHQQLAHVNLHKMSSSSHLNAEQAQVLDTVRGFHKYFSSPPPFKEGQRFALPHGLITVPLPPEMGGLKTERFDDMYERVGGLLAKQQESGFKHQLAEPSAEVWVSQNIAAVFVGWSASMDGRGEFIHTVHLCTLHRQSDDLSDGNPWHISALVDMMHLSPEQPVPSVETGPVSEIIAPLQDFLASTKAQDWEASRALLLPGAGATISKDCHAPETFMWPELIEHLQQEAQNHPTTEKRLLNCELQSQPAK